jgi:hypothetical protein
MITVLTGDIINSRKSDPSLYLKLLKEELKQFGKNPGDWEIYSGDTFQLCINNPYDSLISALRIKAAIKLLKPLDVRIAIGIGEISYRSSKITECNGSAFINSGEKFIRLRRDKQKLAIKSNWPEFDNTMNLCLKLGMIAMDRWSVVSAETVALALSDPDASQGDLGKILKIKQNAVSNRLARAHFDEILEIDKLYKNKLKSLK